MVSELFLGLELIGYKWYCRGGCLEGWGQKKKVRQSVCECFCVCIRWGDVWTVPPRWAWVFGRGGLDVLHHRIHQGQFSWTVGLQKQTNTDTLSHVQYKCIDVDMLKHIDVDVTFCLLSHIYFCQSNTLKDTQTNTVTSYFVLEHVPSVGELFITRPWLILTWAFSVPNKTVFASHNK